MASGKNKPMVFRKDETLMMEIIIAMAVILGAIYLIKKRYDIKVVMFGSGILLMLGAMVLGKSILPLDSSTGLTFFDTGLTFFDIFKVIGNLFTKQLTGASFTLMLLFGYIAYMKEIGADLKTVSLLSRPLRYVKSKGILIVLFFLIGNALCIIIPSASSLSVLLMATAYPVLVYSGVSPLAVAAVIATSATIAPTPIGADNLLASQSLNMSVTDYVFNYHAKISIPVILIMAVSHYVWQKWLDRKEENVEPKEVFFISEKLPNAPFIYAFLPMLPLVLMVFFHFLGSDYQLGISEVTFFSLVVSMICEMFRQKSTTSSSTCLQTFFNGMGVGLTTVVTQVVAANAPFIYAFLPMLPLVLMVFFHFLGSDYQLGISEVTFFSLVVSMICEMFRQKSTTSSSTCLQTFFNGMGVGLTTVVTQVVAALTFVEGLKVLGVIDLISLSVTEVAGAGLILMLIFCLLALLNGLLSGSGLALFYAFVELIPSFALSAGISPVLLAIPMQFVSHLVKSISPVAPTVIIISSMMKISPIQLIKRTVVPVGIGMIFSILLSYFLL